MSKKWRIGLRLLGVGTFNLWNRGNVQGDEGVARCWQKYLLRRPEIEGVWLFGPHDHIGMRVVDVVIHFNPYLDLHPKAKNILYLQNAFPKEDCPGGTVGVFQQVKSRFDGFVFTSEKLMKACGPGVVVPFAADPETFYPQQAREFAHPVSFVGNNLRGPIVNQRFLAPALSFGLVIYGNNAWPLPFSSVCRGKLAMTCLPKVYASSLINLNAHIEEHIVWDTINLRVYEALACGGFLLSDRVESLQTTFEDVVVMTDGDEDEWAKLVRYLADKEERRRCGEAGRRIVLSNHTYAKRMETVVSYLEEVL